MIPLHISLEKYKEGYSVPAICWKVTLRLPPPSDDPYPEDIDVSDRLLSDPNIVDTADYIKNLTYINEVNLRLNNSDGFLSNDSGTGKLDIVQEVEVFIDGYYDVYGGVNHLIRKFGGWVDFNRRKSDSVKKVIDVTAVSYFGLSENYSGARICRRYFTDKGLILFNLGRIYLTDANISGKVLKAGIHKIYSRIDSGNKQLKLDEGEYTTISDGLNVLNNEDDSERVQIYFDDILNYFYEDHETTLIVRNEGDQYPYTAYHNSNMKSLIKKTLAEIKVTDSYVQNYEFSTFDDREVMSFYEAPDDFINSDFNYVNAVIGDGDQYTYFGYKNEVWRRDMLTGDYQRVMSGLNGFANRFVIDTSISTLFVFTVNDVTWVINNIYKLDLDNLENEIIFSNYDSVNDITILAQYQIPFTYSYELHSFVFMCRLFSNNANKKICKLTSHGAISTILSDNSIYPEGFNCLWQDGTNTRYYFLMTGTYGAYTLARITYSSGSWGSINEREAWYLGSVNLETYGINFQAENRVFVNSPINNKPYFTYDFNENSFNSDMNETYMQLLSGIEFNNKLYFIRYDEGTGKYNIATLSDNVITVNDQDLYVFQTHRGGYETQLFAINKNYLSENVINVQTTNYNVMIRFSKWIIPGIFGDADFTSSSIRDVLQDLSVSFLGFVKVDPYKKGYFVSRIDYQTSDELTFKKDYIRTRLKEYLYNENYDNVSVTIDTAQAEFGDTGIEVNKLSLSLKYLNPGFVKDICKYMYDYYKIKRNMIKLSYPPTFYNYEIFDIADLSEFGINNGRIHRVSPRKSNCEFDILLEE